MWDIKKLKEVEKTNRDWKEKSLLPDLEKEPERRERFQTDIGPDIHPIYTPLNLSELDFDYEKDVGFPGLILWLPNKMIKLG